MRRIAASDRAGGREHRSVSKKLMVALGAYAVATLST
jgi:hypothetical protein